MAPKPKGEYMPFDAVVETKPQSLNDELRKTAEKHLRLKGYPDYLDQVDVHVVKEVVETFSKHRMLCSQHAELFHAIELYGGMTEAVAVCDGKTYYTPHGAVDYFIRLALGLKAWEHCGCRNWLTQAALKRMKIFERAHNRVFAAKQKAKFDESEFNYLLTL